MKGNVFSGWLREFCALVFTQTVQAFLLAIILLIVVISISNGDEANNTINITAGGVLAIIALTSLSKIEELIKKLFGLNSSITDPSMKGGRGGLLGSVAAMKMAKKALDNVPKVSTGIKGYRAANRKMKNAELDAINKEAKLRKRFIENHGDNALGDSTSQTASSQTNGGNGTSTGTGTGTGTGTATTVSGNNSSINTASAAGNNINSGNASSNTSSTIKSVSPKDRHKFEDDLDKIKKELKDEKEKLVKEKRDSIKSVASGVTESLGSVYGGLTGALVGLATEDDILKNAGIGVGIGDTIGQKVVDIPNSMYETRKEAKKLKEKYSSYNSNLAQAKQELDRLKEEMKRFNAGDI